MKQHRITLTKDSRAPFTNNAMYCVGTGRMGLALQEEYQKQLRAVQHVAPFEHIRGHGLFTDDMAGQYAWQLLENDFAAKNYGAGVLNLVNGLQGWYDGPYTLAGQLNIGDHNDPNLGFY